MPHLEFTTIADAQKATTSSTRATILEPYLKAIADLRTGGAGILTAAEGEALGGVRRRLGAAAKLMDVTLTIKRKDDRVYFWHAEPPRGGRPRKKAPQA